MRSKSSANRIAAEFFFLSIFNSISEIASQSVETIPLIPCKIYTRIEITSPAFNAANLRTHRVLRHRNIHKLNAIFGVANDSWAIVCVLLPFHNDNYRKKICADKCNWRNLSNRLQHYISRSPLINPWNANMQSVVWQLPVDMPNEPKNKCIRGSLAARPALAANKFIYNLTLAIE